MGPIPSEKNTKYKRGKNRKSDKTVCWSRTLTIKKVLPRQDEYIAKKDKDIYEMVWERDITVADPNDFDDEIDEARREYNARKRVHEEMKQIYS